MPSAIEEIELMHAVERLDVGPTVHLVSFEDAGLGEELSEGGVVGRGSIKCGGEGGPLLFVVDEVALRGERLFGAQACALNEEAGDVGLGTLGSKADETRLVFGDADVETFGARFGCGEWHSEARMYIV